MRLAVALALLGTAVIAPAQGGGINNDFPAATSATYRLRPEDILRIQVFNQPQISAELPVGRDGNISAPFAGIVRAQGKTTSELEQELRERYIARLRLRDPVVSVTLLRARPLQATVSGFVNRPGTIENVRPGETIASLLARGGGPIPDEADLRRATLRRANTNEVIPIDLHSLLNRGDISQNYEIQDGDELSVPRGERLVIDIQGAVPRPGQVRYREPMTLSNAISLAGGEIPYRTKFSQVFIFRERAGMPGEYYRIHADYVRFVKKQDQSQNVLLQPGDFVYVSETNTPDINRISALANTAFIFDRFGSFLGFRLFR